MRGIDVSHWNNLEDIYKHGTQDFIIAKLTEGKTIVDYTAFTYYLYAKAFSQLFGVYHFAHPETNSVLDEFLNFKEHFKIFRDYSIAIYLDVEAKALTLNDAMLDEWCYEWLRRAKELSTSKVGIYISQSQCRRFKKCVDFPLWVARYRKEELGYGDVSPWQNATIWQYDSKGIDKNIMYERS